MPTPLEALKARTPSIHEQLGLPPGGRRSFRCRHPDHPDENPSAQVSRDGNRWTCYGCDRWGDALDLLAFKTGHTVKDLLATTKAIPRIVAETKRPTVKPQRASLRSRQRSVIRRWRRGRSALADGCARLNLEQREHTALAAELYPDFRAAEVPQGNRAGRDAANYLAFRLGESAARCCLGAAGLAVRLGLACATWRHDADGDHVDIRLAAPLYAIPTAGLELDPTEPCDLERRAILGGSHRYLKLHDVAPGVARCLGRVDDELEAAGGSGELLLVEGALNWMAYRCAHDPQGRPGVLGIPGASMAGRIASALAARVETLGLRISCVTVDTDRDQAGDRAASHLRNFAVRIGARARRVAR